MAIPFLMGSLLLLLVSILFSSLPWFAISIVSIITGMAALGLRSIRLLAIFWLWTGSVLLLLTFWTPIPFAELSTTAEGASGLPFPALVMLFGIWLIPVFIWPLGFLIRFKSWSGQ